MLKPVSKSLFSLSAFALAIALTGVSFSAHAGYQYEDEDTILVEKQPNTKIPYSKIIRKISQKLFSFDTHKISHFGKGKKSGVVRNFGDYLDRTKYRVNVRDDRVVFKVKMNF